MNSKNGQRRDHYKETGFDIKEVTANCDQVTMEFTVNNNENTLEATNTSGLIAELKRRNDFDEVFKMATDDNILN